MPIFMGRAYSCSDYICRLRVKFEKRFFYIIFLIVYTFVLNRSIKICLYVFRTFAIPNLKFLGSQNELVVSVAVKFGPNLVENCGNSDQ